MLDRRVAAALIATLGLAICGVLSGALIDEHGGALGMIEWLLRTGVIAFAVVAAVAWLAVLWRLGRRVSNRWAGRALGLVACVAFALLVLMPLGYAIYLTHLPGRRAVHDADLGAPKRAVSFTTRDGIRLRGWYVPSRNRAAVIALHGTGSNRLGVQDHARLLARHGYGVLLFDLPGHGESDGRSLSVGWDTGDDVDAALAWLARRPDVDDGRIAGLGVSLGAEVLLDAAAERRALRALVLEGAQGRTTADLHDGGGDPLTLENGALLFAAARVLSGSGPQGSDGDLLERVRPRRVLLIASGTGTEAKLNRAHARRTRATTALWELPDAAHGDAIDAEPAGYERRVIGFLDEALGVSG